MKFVRIAAAIAAVVLVGRAVSRRLRGQVLAMSHPGGLLGAGGVRGGAGSSWRSGEVDASRAVGASWVDEQALLEAATTGADAVDAADVRSTTD